MSKLTSGRSLNSVRSSLRRHPRRSTAGVAVVLVAAGVGGYLAVSGGGGAAAAQTTAATTTTQTVSTGTIKQSVSASGTLAPAVDDTLTFSSSGVVTSVLVSEGQSVTKGQKLATIDSASLAATVAQDKATVASDEAKVDDDQTNDATAAQLAADEAAVTAAANQLASAETALAGATLLSPVTGVVAAVGFTVGESVSGSGSASGSGSTSGSSSGAGSGGSGSGATTTTASSSSGIEVISTNSWLVNATVDATSVGLIKAGNQAQLAVTGATGTVYGTISSVAVLSSSSGTTASYPVAIAVTGSPSGLHDGESVTATLIYKQLSNVIVVPAAALHRSSSGGEYVEKLVSGKPVQTTVQVGVTSGAETQVTSGLSAGDTIQVPQLRVGTTGGANSTTRTGGTGGTGGYGGFGGGAPGGVPAGAPAGGGAPGGGGFGG